MRLPSRRHLLIAITVCTTILLGLAAPARERALASRNQAPEPFLFPPFPGSASEESVFDHSSPTYSQSDARIVTSGGLEARKNCPVPAPSGSPPPQGGVCDAGYGIYWSYALGDWIAYNGHDGTDYGISYRPLYAAADSDRVMYAGWWDPQNHTTALGIYVKLHHPNGYISSYGHMSSVAVQACLTNGCSNISHGEVLGISGNTGNSTGPHLHFQLTSPAGVQVDPYGWTGAGNDPWPYNQPESLWVMYPLLISYGPPALPSGSVALGYPPQPATGILVDDASAGFSEEPADCWNDIEVSPGQAQNGNLRYVKPRVGAPNCIGRWAFPQGATAGQYALYVRIPAVRATSEGAVYAINHAGQVSRVVINQTVFPNGFYVTDGWVYAGRYGFDGVSQEFVELGNGTHDNSAAVASLELGADAVRFVYLGVSGPTPIPVTLTATNTPPPSGTPTITDTPTASRTPTATRTATASRTPTPSRTPTVTRTPTITRTPSRTPTASRTPSPTHTRQPAATPLYTKLSVYFVNTLRLNAGAPPYEVAGYRWATSSSDFPQVVLAEYFKGPGYTERYSYRWTAVKSGFTGFDRLEVTDGIARVYLRGSCSPEANGYTIAQPIAVNLKQFEQIQFVKIYDENGETQQPEGPVDSIPRCLDPAFAPTRTPTRAASLTPTVTATRSRTATPTVRPTATPRYTLLDVYFYNRSLSLAVGKRWASSSLDLPTFAVDQYFRGPGYVEKYIYGWTAVKSGFTGIDRLEVTDGVARVYLSGSCSLEANGYSIAPPITENLKQFEQIQFVKIYDEKGKTEHPEGPVDSIPRCLDPAFAPTQTPMPAATLTPTITATRPRTATPTVRPTATPLYRLLNIYFYDRSLSLAVGKRWAISSIDLPRFAVDQYFRGPGYVEKYIYRWAAPLNGTTGYSRVEVADGIARVYLTGECNSQGSTFTLAQPLIATLQQFSEIQFVKIYDQNGETEIPEGPQNSIPACLEP